MELRFALNEIIRTNGWKQNFARAVFEALQKAIETARPMGNALREIYDQVVLVVGDTEGFVRDHPFLCALMVLGISILLSPLVIEALGFAEGVTLEVEICPSQCAVTTVLMPKTDSFAAWWQAEYAGTVSEGSLFSLLQRLGMEELV